MKKSKKYIEPIFFPDGNDGFCPGEKRNTAKIDWSTLKDEEFGFKSVKKGVMTIFFASERTNESIQAEKAQPIYLNIKVVGFEWKELKTMTREDFTKQYPLSAEEAFHKP